MKTYLARYWAVYGVSLVAPGLAACGDSTGTETEATTGSSSTTDDGTTSTTGVTSVTTGDDTSTGNVPTGSNSESNSGTTSTTDPDPTTTGATTTDGTTGPVSGTTSGTSTTGPDVCMTILCGDPAVCCLDTEECVGGSCLDICPSGVRCGDNQEMCCADGDVCVGDTCTTPLGDCKDSYDCTPGNYCEPQLEKCLPQPDPLQCEVVPSFDKIDVQLEWSWTASEVLVTPLVADITGDPVPEVVINTNRIDGIDRQLGELVALDGKTGVELWRIKHDPPNNNWGSWGLGTPVIGDVSGDGKPDIVYPSRHPVPLPPNMAASFHNAPIHAVDGDGKLLWTGHDAGNQPVNVRWAHGAGVMANLDDDPEAEIAIGGALFDNDGLLVWNQDGKSGQLGSPTDNLNPPKLLYVGGLATFADLTGDGKPELITGREAWTINWTPGSPPTVSMTLLWKNTDGKGNDGWPSVGDIDGNGTPEVVLVAWPDAKVIDGKTGKLWCGIDPTGVMCNGNDALRTKPIVPKGGNYLNGPATIADFDGDGRPEVGIAGGTAYAVYDFYRAGEEIVTVPGDPPPVLGAMYARWTQAIQDPSSAVTGSSVFDFQGDGAAEVAYQDECKAYIYDGKTGAKQLEVLNSSSTVHEYPLVADVDGDGNAEFLVVANNSEPTPNANCVKKTPGFMPRKGVYSYGAGADNWVPTRKVWTQHTYHVTNADSNGNVPMMEQDNWTADPPLNNFRQNVQGEGVFNAADLTASLAVSLDKCSAELVLQATIYNEGALGVPAGIQVTFYRGIDNTGENLGSKPTIEALLTGGSTTVTWTVDAPPPGQTESYFVEVDGGFNNGIIQECKEDNNGAVVTDAECPTPG